MVSGGLYIPFMNVYVANSPCIFQVSFMAILAMRTLQHIYPSTTAWCADKKRNEREREMVSMCLHLIPYSSNVINSVTHIASDMQSVGQRRDRRVAWHPIGGSHPVVWLSHLFPVTSYTLVCAWLPGLLTFVSHIPAYTAP